MEGNRLTLDEALLLATADMRVRDIACAVMVPKGLFGWFHKFWCMISGIEVIELDYE